MFTPRQSNRVQSEPSDPATARRRSMALLKSDLIRSLTLGFMLGAVGVFATMGGTAAQAVGQAMVPSAYAATSK